MSHDVGLLDSRSVNSALPGATLRSPWRGVVMAMLVGVSFAANTTLAAVSYTGGATPLAVLLARSTVAFIVLYIVLAARGLPRGLSPERRRGALFLGCIFAGYSYGVLVAIKHLPVGLVVATFYIFPIFVGVVEWWSGRHAYSTRTAIALVIAFTGIVLALDLFGAPVHRLGMALCLLGAIGVTVVMTLSPRVRGTGDSRPVTLHMLGMALAIFYLVAAVHGGVALPQTTFAWVGFIGSPLFYTFGIIMLFVVIGRIGPVKTSLAMNIEPVTSVLLGFLVLDQRLGPQQLLGIALVVAAVLLVESARLRRPRQN